MTASDHDALTGSIPISEWDEHYASGLGFSPVGDEEIDLLRQHLGTGHGLRVLDIACGTGGYAQALHDLGYTVTGVDYAPFAIKTARAEYPGLQFLELDIEHGNLGRLDHDYDLITCRLAYAFMADRPAFIKRVRGLLAPGGTLHITTPLADRLPEDRRGIGITAAAAAELRGAEWADVAEYKLGTFACYVLRTTHSTGDPS